MPDKSRVVVEGVAIMKKHTRPNPQKNIKGGILDRESAIHVSNVHAGRRGFEPAVAHGRAAAA